MPCSLSTYVQMEPPFFSAVKTVGKIKEVSNACFHSVGWYSTAHPGRRICRLSDRGRLKHKEEPALPGSSFIFISCVSDILTTRPVGFSPIEKFRDGLEVIAMSPAGNSRKPCDGGAGERHQVSEDRQTSQVGSKLVTPVRWSSSPVLRVSVRSPPLVLVVATVAAPSSRWSLAVPKALIVQSSPATPLSV